MDSLDAYPMKSPLNLALASLFSFGLAAFAADPPAASPIRVSETTLFNDMECFRVETPSATYLFGKRGAGFASILDPAGHDWISYKPGGLARGEYRGLPKCGQPIKYFHCGYGFGQYTNDNWFTFTLEKCGNEGFWFLYEGTPDGELKPDEQFAIRPGGKRTPLSEPWTDVAPWVAFGGKASAYSLVCINHQNDSPVDSYVGWPYKPDPDGGVNEMVVFGFGRPGWTDPKQHTPQMHAFPARFTIALTRVEDAAATADRLRSTAVKAP
jgi:hypothetical protein